ncbi:MAG: DUF3427 domain-containing protein [Bacilli bacterium]
MYEIVVEVEKELNLSNQKLNVNNSIMNLLDKNFKKDNKRIEFKKYKPINIIEKKDKFMIADSIKDLYLSSDIFKNLVDDLLEFNLLYVKDKYMQTTNESIKLYGEYTKKEVFHIMNDDHNPGLIISGYREIEGTDIVMIFSKLDKSSYESGLISQDTLKWVSQKGRVYGKSRLETEIADNKKDLRIFLRRSEGEKYYYVGSACVDKYAQTILNDKPIIEFDLKLKNEIKETLYMYLTMDI